MEEVLFHAEAALQTAAHQAQPLSLSPLRESPPSFALEREPYPLSLSLALALALYRYVLRLTWYNLSLQEPQFPFLGVFPW